MPSISLLLVVLASVPPPADTPPLPASPPEVQASSPGDAKQRPANAPTLAASAPPEAPAAEEPEDGGEELAEESAELEELRALEGATLDPLARPSAEVFQSLRRLGLANPLRQRMLDVLEEPALREDDLPPELPLITDLTNFDIAQVRDRYDIPVEVQPPVAQYLQFFQGPGRKWFRKWIARTTRWLPVMHPILEGQGLPRDTVYLAMIESGFAPNAYSWAHASGPWQFISSTGRQYGLRQDFWVDERRDPIKSTHAAARYLKDLYAELGHWYLAWAGYNTGSGRVRRMVSRHGTDNFWVLAGERGLATETKQYVPKLIAAALIAKHPAAFGFAQEELEYEEPFTYDEVKVTEATDLDVIARAAGVDVQEIMEFNPELKRGCTPPASERKPYVLRLPRGAAPRFTENIVRLAPHERLTFRLHKVKKGETLSKIAQSHGSAAEAILQMNRLKSAHRLRVNAELVIPIPAGRGPKPDGPNEALARKVAQARRSGVTVRPEEEIPAGTPRGPVAMGPIKTETLNGRKRITYGVQSGDSLWAIAQRFRVSADDLLRWNKLTNYKRGLKVGTLLHIWPESAPAQVVERAGTVIAQRESPKPASVTRQATPSQPSTAKAGGRPTFHELAAGESLWTVAQRYGVSVEDIKRWNNIKDHRTLRVGKRLQLVAP